MPKFQPIPNFDSLSPQTTKGDLISRSTTQAVRVAVGSDGQALLADSTQASGVKWGAPAASAAYNVVSKSTTYSAVINDYVLASSSSFTITLPTAVGVSGQMIAVQHAGTSLTQVYTIHTTSSQTITSAGTAYTNTDINTNNLFALYTAGEIFVFVSDGANWQVVNHTTNTGWINFPSVTSGGTTASPGSNLISAVTTAPTFTTTTTNVAIWRRSGQNMEIRWEIVLTAGSAGSGHYVLNLPSSSMDTTKVVVYTGGSGNGVPSGSLGKISAADGSNAGIGSVYAYSATQLSGYFAAITTANTNGFWGTSVYTFASATALSFQASVPISGWLP